MKLIDSHCHLDNEDFAADREAVIQRALDAGVEQMVAIGSGDGPPDLEVGVRLADQHACAFWQQSAFIRTTRLRPLRTLICATSRSAETSQGDCDG